VTEIGIFRLRFPVSSETFIREQMRALTRHRPTVFTRVWDGQLAASMASASAPVTQPIIIGGRGRTFASRAARAFYAVSAAPRMFGPRSALPPVSLIHAHFAPDATYAVPLAKWLGVPLIATFHGWDVTVADRAMIREPSLTVAHYLLTRSALRAQGSAFVAVSDYIRDRLLALGYPADRVVRHYIGVDTDKFTPADGERAERFVLNTARHRDQKGIDTLLRAFARIAPRHPGVTLVQVGSGERTEDLRRLTASLGIADRVRFLGAQPHDAVRALTQRATVFALTGQTTDTGQQEALGLVLNEASACAVPVVATRHGGMPEAVRDGETGILADERDDVAIGAALDTLLGNPELAARMGRQGRQFVTEVFNLRTQTAALEHLYDQVRAEGRP
jgi:colanic acid/amylovoran biosynthesis glycosyltransferase